MLTPEDYELIYKATRDGVFWGSFFGAVVFHLFLFGGIVVLYIYFMKKHGRTIKSYTEIISKLISNFLGIKKE